MSTPPTDRSPDDVRDLLPAYALDAVDDLERGAVERLLTADPAARAELAELRETTDRLAAAVATAPPAALRASVLAEVSRTAQDTPRTQTALTEAEDAVVRPIGSARHSSTRHSSARHSSRGGRVGGARWLVAAAAAVAVVVPSGVAWQQYDRAVTTQERADALAAVLIDPSASLLRGTVEGGGEATAVLADSGAVLLASGLAPLTADRTYQLWAMRDGVPVPAGLLGDAGGDLQVLAEDYQPGDGLALSVEPDGGSEQPTTDPVLVLLPG